MVAPFIMPRDAIAKLGGGDPRRAGAVLRRLFAVDPKNPTTISPEVIKRIGNGDIGAGHRVLRKFISNLRQAGGYRYQRVPQARIIPQPDGNHGRRYAKGGAAKMTKEAAGYRNAIEDGQFCALCDMWSEPHSCSLVHGPISRTSLCDHYQREG
jgi:hypothetical protein